MDKCGPNEGFRVLGDFVCEAIPDPAVPQAPPNQRGQNEGVRVLQELALNIEEKAPGDAASSSMPSELAQPPQLHDFNVLLNLPVEALEERIGAELLTNTLGRTTTDPASRRAATRTWWQSHSASLRETICKHRIIREHLFSPSEKDRHAALALILDTMTDLDLRLPVACLVALAWHYGIEKLCGQSGEVQPE